MTECSMWGSQGAVNLKIIEERKSKKKKKKACEVASSQEVKVQRNKN